MACGFDKGLLAAHHDGETSEAERAEVERHLASCPECARDLASMKELSGALKPLKARVPAPMSIAENVTREISAPRRTRRPWISWGVSAAAALLLTFGTVYLLDREAAPKGADPIVAAQKPRSKAPVLMAERDLKEAAPAPAPDRMDFETREAPRKEPPPEAPAAPAESKEESRQALGGPKAPEVPVVRITSAHVEAAKAIVDSFLREREMEPTPGAVLLGRGAFVRDRYLQAELTDEEKAQLEKRLAALKDTSLAAGSFESEKKRVGEELAKAKAATGDLDRNGDDKSAQLGPGAEKDSAETSKRGRTRAQDRKKIIFVFEPAPVK